MFIKHLMGNKWNALDRKYHDDKEERKERAYIFGFSWEGHMAFFPKKQCYHPGIIPKDRCAVLR